uniref:Uncharacterized protein n=2 Tax=Nicotiana TaxID=4085 RepID=A0A1S3YHA8_TOBAC|nr:PREDICTED: uncharacterized protein LOC104230984 [Nicotiana sylvestris]XP_016451500.1 PREDICTED: uncharacterized protein LOC107776163 [Nicotiana tabacum]
MSERLRNLRTNERLLTQKLRDRLSSVRCHHSPVRSPYRLSTLQIKTSTGSSAIMLRAPKVRSDIWDLFEVKEDNGEVRKVEYKHCGQVYNVHPKRNGTSFLRKHIRRCLERLPGVHI